MKHINDELSLYELLKKSLIDIKGIGVKRHFSIKHNQIHFIADIAIIYNGEPIMIIEVKNKLYHLKEWQSNLKKIRRNTGCRYVFLVDLDKQNVYGYYNSQRKFSLSALDRIIVELFTPIRENKKNTHLEKEENFELSSQFCKTFEDSIKEVYNKYSANKFFKDSIVMLHFNLILLSIARDSFREEFGFSTLKFLKTTDNQFIIEGENEFEDYFFSSLFKTDEKSACRYTYFDTAVDFLKENKYKFGWILAMNDKSESEYAEKYFHLNSKKNKNTEFKSYNELHHNTITSLNKRFISSLTKESNSDELLMWRLYGNDSKGICITLDLDGVDNDKIFIGEVVYSDVDDNNPVLDLIMKLNENLKKLKINMRFSNFNQVWKYFVKPNDYDYEEEIRVLVKADDSIPPKDWKINRGYGILSPNYYINLDSDDFPFKLKEIVLGPNIKEPEINTKQLEELDRRNRQFYSSSRKKIDVSTSVNNNYRV